MDDPVDAPAKGDSVDPLPPQASTCAPISAAAERPKSPRRIVISLSTLGCFMFMA